MLPIECTMRIGIFFPLPMPLLWHIPCRVNMLSFAEIVAEASDRSLVLI